MKKVIIDENGTWHSHRDPEIYHHMLPAEAQAAHTLTRLYYQATHWTMQQVAAEKQACLDEGFLPEDLAHFDTWADMNSEWKRALDDAYCMLPYKHLRRMGRA